MAIFDNPTDSHLMPHIQRTPMNIGITLYPYKLESLRYISTADSMGLSSFNF